MASSAWSSNHKNGVIFCMQLSPWLLVLQACPVELGDSDRRQIEVLGAAEIDHDHRLAVGAGPLGERRTPAGLAELMADDVLAEGIDGDVVARGLEVELV